MDINELPNHGVTILVRCKGYDTGKEASDPNEAHLWTASCKPWDVVTVDTRIPNGINKD